MPSLALYCAPVFKQYTDSLIDCSSRSINMVILFLENFDDVVSDVHCCIISINKTLKYGGTGSTALMCILTKMPN